MSNSTIEWTDKTWNPTTGCDKVSQGCKHCYAETMSKRLQAMGVAKYKDNFKLRMHLNTLDEPFKWRKPSMVFVNSMSDLFHKDVSTEFIQKVFKVMNDNPKHIFQVLTKRAERLLDINKEVTWTKNIWMGVSVEDSSVLGRIDYLREIDAKTKFLSVEPLLGAIPNLDLKGIHWVIVGGESGRKARHMEPAWVHEIHKQCLIADVPFFFKQWGGTNKKEAGRILNGRTYDEMPKPRL